MGKSTKVVKTNQDLYNRLLSIGGISEAILKLVIAYTPEKMRFVQKNGTFFLEIEHRLFPYNVTAVTKPYRVPQDVYYALVECRLVPNEDLNCVLFRLLTYYENRPKLPILLFFHGINCSMCTTYEQQISKFLSKKSNKKLLDVIWVDDDIQKAATGLIARAFSVKTVPDWAFLDPDCNIIKVDSEISAIDLEKTAANLNAKYCQRTP